MSYRFTEAAIESLESFSQEVTEEIMQIISGVAEEDFYNHGSYSCVYDEHGRPHDKLDLKTENLNHRVFFTEANNEVIVLEIFHRNEIEYGKSLYNLLDDLEERD